MRPAPLLIAAAGAALIAASALAAPSGPSTSGASGSTSSSSGASASTPPAADTGSSANTSATAGGFTVGEAVKDNTGAAIGTIASLATDSTGKQAAVIKMGTDQFQVATANLGQANGAATINLSKAQIQGMLHKDAGATAGATAGAAGGATGAATGGSTMPGGSTSHP